MSTQQLLNQAYTELEQAIHSQNDSLIHELEAHIDDLDNSIEFEDDSIVFDFI